MPDLLYALLLIGGFALLAADAAGAGDACERRAVIVGGLIALGLLVYLVVALLRPERF